MKNKLLISIGVLILLILNYSSAQNVIHSTTEGGLWPNNTTWIEAVPSDSDSVVLQGPVSMLSYNGWCKSLNITTNASLGGNGGQGNLYIYGSMYNDGDIQGSMNYVLQGNLVNNQPWAGVDNHLLFTGMNHTISCANGASINAQLQADDSLHNFSLLSDAVFNTTNASNLGFSQLDAGIHKLTVTGGQIHNCRLHSSDTLQFDAITGNLEITGDYKITGNMVCYINMAFLGTATNYGNISFMSGIGGDPLKLKDYFINEGTMNHSWVQVEKNITNHGIWSSYTTEFTGAGDKHISQSAGHPFGGVEQFLSDNSGSTIFLDTDVEFTVPVFHLNNNTLNCGNHTLTANTTFFDGTINSESEIAGNNDFWTSTFTGNFRFSGNNRFSNCTVDGILENTGLMKDITFYGGTFNSYQQLINFNSIQSMNLKIYGNLTNYGSINDNTIADVTGNTNQYIDLTQSIESQVNFYSDITGTSYQWMKDGQDIYNANGVYLRFNNLQLSDEGIYKCRVTTMNGTEYSREIIVNNTTGLPDTELSLVNLKVYPNPVHDMASLEYYLPENSTVSLEILNIKGTKVLVQQLGEQAAGAQYCQLSCSDFAKGIYFVRLYFDNRMIAKKIIKI